jgi:hypothetical protein
VDDENEGLCSGTENCWAINSQASEEDIESSLAFLQWVVSSDEGRRVTNEDMGLTMNFDTYTGDYVAINPFGAAAQELAAEGKTVVLVLHDLPMAMRCADSLAILYKGKCLFQGSPEEVFVSGCLDTAFSVALRRFSSPEGWQYYCCTSPSDSRESP